MMLAVGVHVIGSCLEPTIITRVKSFSLQTHHGVQVSSNEFLSGVVLKRLRECRPRPFSRRKEGIISTSEVSCIRDADGFGESKHLAAKGARVRLSGLPKKRNIRSDLWSAFWDIPEIINILPYVSDNKSLKNPICKGFAFVDFRYDEDAVRFVQRFSGQKLSFGNIQKRIKCAVVSTSPHPATNVRDEYAESIPAVYSDSERTNPVSSDEDSGGGTPPVAEADQGCTKLVWVPKGVDGRTEKSSGKKGNHVCVPEVLTENDIKNSKISDASSSRGLVEDDFVSDIFSLEEPSFGRSCDDGTNELNVFWGDGDEGVQEIDFGSLFGMDKDSDGGFSQSKPASRIPKKAKKSKKKKVNNKRR